MHLTSVRQSKDSIVRWTALPSKRQYRQGGQTAQLKQFQQFLIAKRLEESA